jgi:predicted CXXCH cytochrome family protein
VVGSLIVASSSPLAESLPAATEPSGHRVDPMPSHPVGIVPTRRVPDHLPLEDGRITCLTCHDPTAVVSATGGGVGLRAETAAALCAACHDPASPARADQHATALRRAHLLATPATSGGGDGLDPESVTCLGCHDGTVLDGGGYGAPEETREPSWERLAAMHPIGVEQRPRYAGDTLQEPDSIDPRIRLFDGRVGCGSCHDIYSGVPGLLSVSNNRSYLCLSCHGF